MRIFFHLSFLIYAVCAIIIDLQVGPVTLEPWSGFGAEHLLVPI